MDFRSSSDKVQQLQLGEEREVKRHRDRLVKVIERLEARLARAASAPALSLGPSAISCRSAASWRPPLTWSRPSSGAPETRWLHRKSWV